MTTPPFSSVDGLLRSLESLEGRPGDDVVPVLPHLLQTADILSSVRPHDSQLVAAGLLHDIASALDEDCGDHARLGAVLLGPLLGPRVGRLVAGHTEAKRYLVTTEKGYARRLSADSTHTLALQGGPMTPGEVDAFGVLPHKADLVALRRADDAAKVAGREVPSPRSWRGLLDEVARTAGGSGGA